MTATTKERRNVEKIDDVIQIKLKYHYEQKNEGKQVGGIKEGEFA
jgi:nitrate reductase NapAB chaperone NapD